jgi:hypothetical protein
LAGLVKERLNDGIYKHNNANIATYSVAVTEEEYRRVEEILDYFVQNQNKFSFNKLGLVLNALDIPINRQYSFFCSQFVAFLLDSSGVKLFDKNYGLVRPNDFTLHPNLLKLNLF